MFNRYVDGLATSVPPDPAMYDVVAKEIVEHGYLRTTPRAEPPSLDADAEALRQTA
jgi:hypothetical protein